MYDHCSMLVCLYVLAFVLHATIGEKGVNVRGKSGKKGLGFWYKPCINVMVEKRCDQSNIVIDDDTNASQRYLFKGVCGLYLIYHKHLGVLKQEMCSSPQNMEAVATVSFSWTKLDIEGNNL